MKKKQNEQYSEAETAERRDAVLKRMLNTPPKPHSEMTVGKRKAKNKSFEDARSAIDALDELIGIFSRNYESVDLRSLINEFIDQRPCLGMIQVNDGAALGRGATQPVVSSKPSDHLLRTLAAARAIDQAGAGAA